MLLSDLNFQINRDTEKPTVSKLLIRYDWQGKHTLRNSNHALFSLLKPKTNVLFI